MWLILALENVKHSCNFLNLDKPESKGCIILQSCESVIEDNEELLRNGKFQRSSNQKRTSDHGKRKKSHIHHQNESLSSSEEENPGIGNDNSSFVDETLSDSNGVSHHEDEDNQYRLNVISTEDPFSQKRHSFSKSNTYLEDRNQKLLLRHPSTFQDVKRGGKEGSSISSKEMALNFLNRNQDSDVSFIRNNSMLTNQTSYESFTRDLIGSINVPEHIRLRRLQRCRYKKSESMPKKSAKGFNSEASLKGKKQVRFADTAGEGPLASVCKSGKRSKAPEKKSVEKTSKTSCSCTIF
ncbi:unnamed protein product [Moneuplotes crassus]|uniref:Uncharacterized protein n=1 Tax=Euplotes crassus TaxID=5936 RepID=A0AAD1X829_EUPCR|nr:unnamed protein product [Moneuplotes crassus]